MVTSVGTPLEGIFQAAARGGEIAFPHIEQCTHAYQSAQDTLIAEFQRQALGFV
jgi:hypothetical protein